MGDKSKNIAKLQAKIKRLEAANDELQVELAGFSTLRANGFLPDGDEPFFILLGRDPFAQSLVEAWAFLRMGRTEEARRVLSLMLETRRFEPQSSSDPQILSAFRIAARMKDWFAKTALKG